MFQAAVCMRGHTNAQDIETLKEPVPAFCWTCGAKVITVCPSCGVGLRGGYLQMYTQRSEDIAPMAFCTSCGHAYPWATREQRIGQLYNLLDFEDSLTEADRLAIAEALAVLSDPETAEDDAAQERAAGVFKRLAPKAWDVAQPVLVGVLSAAARRGLGLP